MKIEILAIVWAFCMSIILGSYILCGCTSAPINVPYTTYELVEPLGTKHKYRKEPNLDKSYYCIIHEVPEIIYEIDGTKRVRQWTGHSWR